MIQRLYWPALGIVLASSLMTCQPADQIAETDSTVEAAMDAPAETQVIDVIASDYAFTAPPTFPSGWITLRFKNEGEQSHFLLLYRLPEGKIFDDYVNEVGTPFDALFEEYRVGTLDQAQFFEQLGSALPDWFTTMERKGGPGFTAPGRISETTVYLEPGDYVMECYVKAPAPEIKFHSSLGMLRPLIVTAEASSASPPEADIEITLSNYELTVDGDLTPGEHIVGVRIEENPEGMPFHNVHLARLNGDTGVEEVAQWMDWVDAMVPPAPAEFMGGAGQAMAGQTSYFTVTLEPGRYAWLSEAYGIQGMVREFTVE